MSLTENVIKHLNGEGLSPTWVSMKGNQFNSDVEITQTAINSAILDEVRIQRDKLLAETDWWCASDRTPTQAQLDYRQSLRDLPSTASPSLDEDGNLTGVTWPTKPE